MCGNGTGPTPECRGHRREALDSVRWIKPRTNQCRDAEVAEQRGDSIGRSRKGNGGQGNKTPGLVPIPLNFIPLTSVVGQTGWQFTPQWLRLSRAARLITGHRFILRRFFAADYAAGADSKDCQPHPGYPRDSRLNLVAAWPLFARSKASREW